MSSKKRKLVKTQILDQLEVEPSSLSEPKSIEKSLAFANVGDIDNSNETFEVKNPEKQSDTELHVDESILGDAVEFGSCLCKEDPNVMKLFVDQVTDPKKCYHYTGLSREKLDLIFGLIEEKAKRLRYWKGSMDAPKSKPQKKGVMLQGYCRLGRSWYLPWLGPEEDLKFLFG